MKAKRYSKYKAVRTAVDGVTFASKKEARRYSELKLLEKAGRIRGLELQPSFPLCVHGNTICTYRADFRYFDLEPSGHLTPIVEDVKGVKTAVYRIKKKLLKAIYGIEIRET